MKIKKTKLNFTIDILMFIVMVLLVGIGFLIKYVLIPGFERNAVYGRDVELYYLGIDRHQWGAIHLIVGFVLLFLLLLHIVFHWKQIVCIFKNMVPARGLRVVLGFLLVLITILFGVAPLFVSPEINEGSVSHVHQNIHGKGYHKEERQHKNREVEQTVIDQQHRAASTKNDHKNSKHATHSNIEIFGYMTINEVAKKYNIPARDLAKSIHVPAGNYDERLGRLKKKYAFQLSQLKDYIDNNINTEGNED